MWILDRYIGITIASSTFFVMLVLVSLFSFFTFAGELNHTGKGNYDSVEAIKFALYSMPSMLYQLFPAAALIGAMSGLGILANNSELVAMRAAGYSLSRILRSVFLFSFLLMVVVALIGEYIAPMAQQHADTQRSLALSGNKAKQTRGGVWLRDGPRFIRIGEIQGSRRLHQISIYELNEDQQLIELSKINNAVNFRNDRWLLSEYDIYRMDGANVNLEQKGRLSTKTFISPDVLNLTSIKPESMSAQTAYMYVDYLEENGVDASNYEQAFWMKVAAPLSTFVMVMLAIPIVMGSIRAMTAGHRILIGTLIGIGFYLINQVLAYVGLAFELNPFLVAFLPLVVFAFLSLRLMKTVR